MQNLRGYKYPQGVQSKPKLSSPSGGTVSPLAASVGRVGTSLVGATVRGVMGAEKTVKNVGRVVKGSVDKVLDSIEEGQNINYAGQDRRSHSMSIPSYKKGGMVKKLVLLYYIKEKRYLQLNRLRGIKERKEFIKNQRRRGVRLTSFAMLIFLIAGIRSRSPLQVYAAKSLF